MTTLSKDISFVAGLGQDTGGSLVWSATNFASVDFVAGDLALVFAESSQTVTPPAGWDTIPGCPVVATGTTLYGFYRFKGDWTNTGQSFTGSDHQYGSLVFFRNVDSTNPFAANATSVENTVTTAMSWPGITTTRDNSWVVYAAARAQNPSSSAQQGTVTPPSGVTSIVERYDKGGQLGDDGGVSVVTGFAATAGTFGSATATLTTASEQALLTLALNPQQYTGLILDANSTNLTPQVSGTTNSFNNVRYLEGAYYALGSSGANFRSADGVNWSASLFTGSGVDIAFGNGVYIATNGTALFQRSTNGTTFSGVSHGQAQIPSRVAFGSDVFVVVGASGVVVTSTDGTVWTRRTSGVTTRLNGIIWTGSQFVAVGDSGVVLTSPDGTTWTRQNNVPNSSDLLNSVAFGDGVYVASAGASNSAWVSHDAVNWLAIGVSLPSSSNQRVNWTGSQFVLTTSVGGLATSPDGYKWTVLSTGTTTNITGSAVNGDQMVLVGSGGAIWTTTPPSRYQFGVQSSVDSGPRVNRLRAGNDFRATASLNAVSASVASMSTDGMGRWFGHYSSTTINSCSFSSDNGQSFASKIIATTGRNWGGSGYANGVMFVLGAANSLAAYSVNGGETWQELSFSSVGASLTTYNVVYFNGNYIFGSTAGNVIVTPDLLNHTLINVGGSSQILDIACSPTSVVVTSTTGTFRSANGTTWQSVPTGATSRTGLCYGGDRYLEVRAGSCYISTDDGLTFSLAATGLATGEGNVNWEDGRFVRCTAGFLVETTADGLVWGIATYGLTNFNSGIYRTAFSGGRVVGTNVNTTKNIYYIDLDPPARIYATGYDAFFSNVIAYQFSAEQGAYTAAAQNANLLFSRWLTAGVRSYAYAGQSATLSYGRNLPTAQGSCTLNGLSVGAYYSRSLPADAGAYNATYLTANLLSGLRLVAAPAPLQTVGVAAGTLAGRRAVADQNSATVLPRDAQVLAGRRMASDAQSLAYTGIASDVRVGRRVLADARSYTTASQSASLLSSRWLLASQEPLSVSLLPVNLATGFGLVANPGMFALSAPEAQWAWNRVLSGEAVNYNHAVYQASLLAARRFGADAALYSTSFQPSTLAYGRHVTAALGAYNLQTSNLLFGRNYQAHVDTGGFNVLGSDSQANKTLFFGVQPGLFQILGYSSQPFFSALAPAKDVVRRTEELRRAQRPQEVKLAVRRPDTAAAVLPAEDTVSFVVPRDPAVRGSEDRITYH